MQIRRSHAPGWALGLLMASAGAGTAADFGTCQTVSLKVWPRATSDQLAYLGYGEIGTPNDDWSPNLEHVVKRPPASPACGSSAPALRKLVVFLPGCSQDPAAGEGPSSYSAFLNIALEQKYYVIGLDYPNLCNVVQWCPDTGCTGDVRWDVGFGIPSAASSRLEDHPQDAITKRLKALLREMRDRDPNGQWGDFLVPDAATDDGFRPAWGRIVVAGHSLGAGYAAFLADKFEVDRVVMLAGPTDMGGQNPWGPFTPTAGWIATAGATHPSRYWGLVHDDDVSDFDRVGWVTHNWNEIGVRDSQRWRSTQGLAGCDPDNDWDSGDRPHGAVALCSAIYAPRWRQMLGTP